MNCDYSKFTSTSIDQVTNRGFVTYIPVTACSEAIIAYATWFKIDHVG